MVKWPHDNQAERNAFYGDPAKGEIADQLVPVVPPFMMYFDGKPISKILFHPKAAPALSAALNEIWDYYDRDQKKIDAAGISKYAGAYNHRLVRGSKTKWSNHAYGCAIDLNAEENGLNAKGNMPQPVIDAFCRQGWMWGGWYKSRLDPMHFEAVDNGGRKPSSAPKQSQTIAAVPDLPPVKTVTTLRTVAGAGATVLAGGQVAKSTLDSVNEIGEKVTQVTDTSGHLIEATKQVVAVPKPGFWFGVLHVITSPEFVVAMVALGAASWAIIWFIQRQHAKAQQQ